jgi:hypothetical protein
VEILKLFIFNLKRSSSTGTNFPVHKLSYPCTGLNRPLGFQEVKASRIAGQAPREGSKFVSPTHWPLWPPSHEIPLVIISFRGWVDLGAIVRPVGFSLWKILVTPSGVEPAKFWPVAQYPNLLRNVLMQHQIVFFFVSRLVKVEIQSIMKDFGIFREPSGL